MGPVSHLLPRRCWHLQGVSWCTGLQWCAGQPVLDSAVYMIRLSIERSSCLQRESGKVPDDLWCAHASHIYSACAAVVATEGTVATVGAMGATDVDGDAASLDANLIAQRAASSGPLPLSSKVPAFSCN